MKKIFLTMLLTAVFMNITLFAAAETKVAVLDVQEVVAKSRQVRALKNEHLQKSKEIQKWLKSVRAEVQKQTNEEEKAKLVKKYDEEFAKKQQAMRKEYSEKLQVIDKDINAQIVKIAKEKGYDMVISKGTTIYSDNDITAEVIKAIK